MPKDDWDDEVEHDESEIVEQIKTGNPHTDDVVYIEFTEEFVEHNYEDFMDGDMRTLTMGQRQAAELRDKINDALMRAGRPG